MGLDIKLSTWERKVLSGTQRLYFSLFVSYLFVQHFFPLHTSSSLLGAGRCIFGLLGFFDSVDLFRWATPLLSKTSSLDWEFWAVAMMIMTMTDERTAYHDDGRRTGIDCWFTKLLCVSSVTVLCLVGLFRLHQELTIMTATDVHFDITNPTFTVNQPLA